MQNAEEERRVILDMNSTDMENNRINADYLVRAGWGCYAQNAFKRYSFAEIVSRLFFLYSTWVLREDDASVHTASSATTLSSQMMSDLRSYHTHHTVSTLHDSSIGALSSELTASAESAGPAEPNRPYDSYKSYESASESVEATARVEAKRRVIGRVDFEKCICELLPKASKSQCVTEASRLFERAAKERYVSKTVDGPCCNLFVLDRDGFAQTLSMLAAKGEEELGEEELKGRIIAEAKYNLQLVQRIVEYDMSTSVYLYCCVCFHYYGKSPMQFYSFPTCQTLVAVWIALNSSTPNRGHSCMTE